MRKCLHKLPATKPNAARPLGQCPGRSRNPAACRVHSPARRCRTAAGRCVRPRPPGAAPDTPVGFQSNATSVIPPSVFSVGTDRVRSDPVHGSFQRTIPQLRRRAFECPPQAGAAGGGTAVSRGTRRTGAGPSGPGDLSVDVFADQLTPLVDNPAPHGARRTVADRNAVELHDRPEAVG